MNKNLKINCIIALLIIIVICCILCLKFDNKNVSNKNLKQNSIAVMVYDNSLGKYVEQDDFPVGNYRLVRENSVCLGGSEIGNYDKSKGQVSFSFVSNDQCFLYFAPL